MAILKAIALGFISVVLSIGGHFGVHQVSAPLKGASFNPTGGGTYRLASAVSSTQTTIKLSSFAEPVSGTLYTMSYLNSTIEYGTLDPQTNNSEFISFTGITQNSDGSATLTGVVRGLAKSYPYTTSSTYMLSHSGQSIFILSTAPQLFSQYAVKSNDENITGSWSVPTPVAPSNPANKDYVDTHVNGGTISVDTVVVAGTAATTISSGKIVYFNVYTSEWDLAKADVASTSSGVLLGVAQGSGTVGVSISGGVLIRGLDSKNTGGTAGNVLYISSATAGATSTSAGTFEKPIGVVKSSSGLYFDPAAFATGITVSTGKLNGDLVPSKDFGDGRDGDVTIAANSTTTLTRDMYYNNLTDNGSLVTGNWRVFVANTISGTGNVTATGTPGVAGVNLTKGIGGATTTGYFIGCAGGTGGDFKGTSNLNGVVGSSTPNIFTTFTSGSSGAGGSGGSIAGGGTGAAGGAAGTNNGTTTPYGIGTLSSIFDAYEISTTTGVASRLAIGSGGAGGGSGGSHTNNSGSGGGGGACGGVAFIAAHAFSGTFAINVSGGNGGNGETRSDDGAGGGGGGGGKGGIGIVVYQKKTWTGTCNAVGGTGGAAGTGTGGTGAGTNGGNGANGMCLYLDIANTIR